MRRRFSLYGFLKNQRYFEPFLWLAFLDRGLDFLDIGILVAIQEMVVVALEVPSGALADSLGRRRAMILSFAAYLVAFPVLAFAPGFGTLALGMAAYGIGDAFRTGTHKAMIFDWLASQGRQDERTEFYGYTRSWSKLGSAVSIVVGAALVLTLERYEPLFLIAMVPYLVGIVNFLGYPANLDGAGRAEGASPIALLRGGITRCWRDRPLRRLLLESMGFEGLFHAVKDYLQPLLAVAASTALVALSVETEWSEVRRTALLVGPVYFVLYLGAAAASRGSHRLEKRAGDPDRGARILWLALLAVSALLALGDLTQLVALPIVALVAFHLLQNFWRPLLVSRVDPHAPDDQRATVLSMESLARHTATMMWAPIMGAAVDWATRAPGLPGRGVWVIGAAGCLTALGALASSRQPGESSSRG